VIDFRAVITDGKSGIPSSFSWDAVGGKTHSVAASSLFGGLLGSCCLACELKRPVFCDAKDESEQVVGSLRHLMSPSKTISSVPKSSESN